MRGFSGPFPQLAAARAVYELFEMRARTGQGGISPRPLLACTAGIIACREAHGMTECPLGV